MSYNEHRNQKELKSGRGWIYFIVGCLVALFLGGAVRVALSPKRIQNEISARLEKAKVNVAVEGLRASLNNGLWPRFGFVAKRTSITPKETCGKWSEIVVENLYLPLGWNQNALAFRTLEADHVVVRMREEPCSAENDKAASSGERSGEKDLVTLADRWVNEVTNFKKYLNRVRIHKVTVATRFGRELSFQNLDLNAAEWPVQFNFDWMLTGVGWIHANLLGRDRVMELQFNSSVKEGQAKGSAQLDLEQGNLASNLDIQHWPLQHLVEQAKHWGTDISFNPKSTWLTCRVSTQAAWNLMHKAPLNFDHCSISGALGTIRVEDLALTVGEFERFTPFKLVVENLDVKQLMQSLGREGLSGISSEYGSLSGFVDVKGPKDLIWKGRLSDAVLHFSNKGRRAYQKISSVNMDLQMRAERMKGLLYSFVLEQGEIQGQVRIDLNKNARDGTLFVQMPSVDFNKEVQKLMVDGSYKHLSINGQASVSGGAVQTWSGHVRAEKIDSSYLVAHGVNLTTDFLDQKFTARTSIQQLVIRPSHKLYDKFRYVFLPATSEGEMVFNVQNAKLNVDRNGLQWSQLYARSEARTIAGYGFWQFDGPVSGEVTMVSDTKSKLKWLVKGSSEEWKLVKAGVDGSIRY